MSKKLLLTPLFLLFALSLLHTKPAKAISENVVISEIQIAGTTSTDEFIELFNISNQEVLLDDWRLTKKTAAGNESILVSSLSGTIAPNSHLLIAHPNYDGVAPSDLPYSASSNSVAANNTILLYDSEDAVIDKVGLGTAGEVETASVPNPPTDGSVRRINNQDTDNNSTDFETLEISDPQNSTPASPTPSPAPTPSPTPTATPSPSPSPTTTPSPSPTPIETPSPSPTESPSPTPSPTSSPSPSPSPSESPTPSPSPTSTPRPRFLGNIFTLSGPSVCQIEYKRVRIGFLRIFFPVITCQSTGN